MLKRQSQVRLAELQDETVDILYSIDPNAVLHGGTAIWRCLQGNRFSEDIDCYSLAGKNFRAKLEAELKKRNLILKKFKESENTVFSKISNSQTEVSLEVSKRKSPEKIQASFEKSDGSSTEIFTLSIEGFIIEKVDAFLNRRLIRDLYDLWFLSSKTEKIEKSRKALEKLFKNYKVPVDEKNLKTIVFSGIAPPSKAMLEKILQRLSQ
ncbi:MAG: nucleotidyl transferase AbiEii/AbiGii toxin family protein [Candidatus ainarchaeum sp.]|nr:nucleotidyl transferase AbiEii/AbiGii toxin family protein [Candidatus ainarchaeum sp.]